MKSFTIRNIMLVVFVSIMITLILSKEAAQAQTKTYELRVATYVPPNIHISKAVDWWVAELGKRTGGRAKATAYHSETLGKVSDSLNMLNSGTADVCLFPVAPFASRFPISELVVDTPLLGGNIKVEEEVLNRLLSAGLLKEYDPFRVIGWFPIDPMMLFTIKHVTTLDDLKGLKIRARGKASSMIVKKLQAVPVSLEVTELYTALERGSVDGVLTAMTAFVPLKLIEVCDYTLDEPLFGGIAPMLMSGRTWNSLPQDIQAIVEQLNKDLSSQFYNYTVEVVKKAYTAASQGKKKITKLSAADRAALQKLLDSVTDEFVTEANAKGLPGTEVQRKAKEVLEMWKSGKLK